METTKPKQGVLRAAGRAARSVGRAYAWTVVGDLDERKRDFAHLRTRVDRLLNPVVRVETFEEAVARKGITEDDLKRQASELSAMAMLYGLICVLAILFALAAGYTGNPVNHLVTTSGVLLVALSKFLACRFRVAQIEQRRFFSFKAWLLRQVKPVVRETGK